MARLLAFLAVPAAGINSFLQPDACACVNWREAYRSGGAACGDGYEFFGATKRGIPREVAMKRRGEEFCTNFYTRMDDDFCMNLVLDNEPQEWYGGQWCYVSGKCASAAPANGTGSLKVKVCSAEKDKMLRDYPPEALANMATEKDFDVGLLVKMAYPVEKKARWPLVKSDFLRNEPPQQRLEELLSSGKPIVLDSDDGHPPFAIVSGSKAQEVTFDWAHFHPNHPSSITKLSCLKGC